LCPPKALKRECTGKGIYIQRNVSLIKNATPKVPVNEALDKQN